MIIYNLLATAMLFVSLVIGALIAAGLHRMNSYDSPVFLVATGFFMIVLDFWYRTTRGEGAFLHPRRGGQFFFIPVWVIGAGLVVFNFFLMFVNEIGVTASASQKSSKPAAFAYTPERTY